jgi:TonB family protein
MILKHLLLSSACLWACWLLYRFVLRGDTFFGRNRAYLLTTLAVSMLAPLAYVGVERLQAWLAADELPLGPALLVLPLQAVAGTAPAGPARTDWASLAFWAWAAGAGFMAWRLVAGLWQTISLLARSPWGALPYPLAWRARVAGARVVVQAEAPTFSFFQYLAWNENPAQSEDDQAQVLAHELAHIQGRHSWDVLAAELAKVLLWFNPVAYWYAAALKAQHEFLADANAVATGQPQGPARPDGYIRLMVRSALAQNALSLTHSFHDSPVKVRIAMLQRARTALWKGNLKTGLALAVAALAALAIGCTNSLEQLVREQRQERADRKDLVDSYATQIDRVGAKYGVKADGIGFEVRQQAGSLVMGLAPAQAAKVTNPQDRAEIERLLTLMAQEQQLDLAKIKQETDALRPNQATDEVVSEVFTIVEQGAEPAGGYDSLLLFIRQNTRYPQAARDAGVEGKVYVQYIVEQDGTLSDFKVIKGIGYGCDEEAVRVMQAAPRWRPGYQRGRAIRQRVIMPIGFRLSGPEAEPARRPEVKQPNQIKVQDNPLPADVYTVVEQKAVPVGGYEELIRRIQININYPASARKAGAEGKVYVRMVIETDGRLGELKILKGVGHGLDEEALRVVALAAPKWEPGQHQGRTVRQAIVIPIAFRLGN